MNVTYFKHSMYMYFHLEAVHAFHETVNNEEVN